MASLYCFFAKVQSLTVYRNDTKIAGRDSTLAVLSVFTFLIDYGHKGTMPVPGESSSLGWFNRWYGYRLLYAASEVRSLLIVQPLSFTDHLSTELQCCSSIQPKRSYIGYIHRVDSSQSRVEGHLGCYWFSFVVLILNYSDQDTETFKIEVGWQLNRDNDFQ